MLLVSLSFQRGLKLDIDVNMLNLIRMAKLSIHHLPWHAKTKRFVSVYKSFVSPQTIADIQDVLVKPLNTLKSIREAQGSALLTRKHQKVL